MHTYLGESASINAAEEHVSLSKLWHFKPEVVVKGGMYSIKRQTFYVLLAGLGLNF